MIDPAIAEGAKATEPNAVASITPPMLNMLLAEARGAFWLPFERPFTSSDVTAQPSVAAFLTMR
jgi:hypothetical protein